MLDYVVQFRHISILDYCNVNDFVLQAFVKNIIRHFKRFCQKSPRFFVKLKYSGQKGMILNFWAKPLWDGNFLEKSGTYFREKSFFPKICTEPDGKQVAFTVRPWKNTT